MTSEGVKKKVLVIDDEEPFLEALSTRLANEGYEVLGALTGERGLTLARKEVPDAIILDIFLPGEDGLAILKSLKRPLDPETGEPSKTREIPVIVLTGPGEKMERIFQMEGAFSFFKKPFETQKLLVTLREALEKKEK